jgi:hypothetical protein
MLIVKTPPQLQPHTAGSIKKLKNGSRVYFKKTNSTDLPKVV